MLRVLRQDILNPATLTLAIETTIERYGARPQDVAQQRATIEAELRRLTSEIDTLYTHLASGLANVREKIIERERRQADLRIANEHWPAALEPFEAICPGTSVWERLGLDLVCPPAVTAPQFR